MQNLISDIKEKNRTVIFSVVAFFLCVLLADFMDPPRSYPDTVLKGNPTYFDNFKEAFYLRERGMDPYSVSQYFSQNYLAYWVLYQIREQAWLLKGLQLFFIVSMAALYGQIVGGTRKVRTIITSLILVNPITIYFYREQTTSFFEFTLIFAPIYGLVIKKKFLTSAFLFGLLVYFNPRGLIFVSVLSQTFSERGKLNKRSFALFLGLASTVAFLLYALTDIVSGKEGLSWQLLMATGRHRYIVPDIGNFYDSFAMIFETHESTFSLLVTCTPYFTIIPTIAYFQRVLGLLHSDERIAKAVDPLKLNLGACLLLNFIFSPHPTALDIVLISVLVTSMHNLIGITALVVTFYAPFILLIWGELRRFVYDRDQFTYGREFEVKMAFYMSFVVGYRFTFSKIDSLVKKALNRQEELKK